MKRTHRIKLGVLLCIEACGLFQPALHGQGSSTFDTGFDGWNPIFFGWSWQSDGGNPGGFVQFAESGIPPYTSMAAPATFLGDWSSLDGIGSLGYDFRLFSGTPDSTAGIMVTGGFGTSGSMFWRQPVTAGPLGWETVTAPLNQSAWEIQDGTWGAILSSVTEVRIFPDYFDHFGEVTGVDNIALVPEPSPAATVAVALVIFGCACLWRRKTAAGRPVAVAAPHGRRR